MSANDDPRGVGRSGARRAVTTAPLFRVDVSRGRPWVGLRRPRTVLGNDGAYVSSVTVVTLPRERTRGATANVDHRGIAPFVGLVTITRGQPAIWSDSHSSTRGRAVGHTPEGCPSGLLSVVAVVCGAPPVAVRHGVVRVVVGVAALLGHRPVVVSLFNARRSRILALPSTYWGLHRGSWPFHDDFKAVARARSWGVAVKVTRGVANATGGHPFVQGLHPHFVYGGRSGCVRQSRGTPGGPSGICYVHRLHKRHVPSCQHVRAPTRPCPLSSGEAVLFLSFVMM